MSCFPSIASSKSDDETPFFEQILSALSCCWGGREISVIGLDESAPLLAPLPLMMEYNSPSMPQRVSIESDKRKGKMGVAESVSKAADAQLFTALKVTAPSGPLPGQEIRNDSDFGKVTLQPFTPTWLSDYPQIIEHLESEHLLHVKGCDESGEGLNWHKEKFNTDMEPRFNPEAKLSGSVKAGIQMKMGYFIVPKHKMELIKSLSLSRQVAEDLKVYDKDQNLVGYRFFVHPEAYNHFRSLHQDQELRYVKPEDSEFVSTPTSSYRSLATRRVEADCDGGLLPVKGSVPFIVKLGVGGSVLGSDRWLSTAEIERSVQCQKAFDGMPAQVYKGPTHAEGPVSEFSVFSESMGMILKGIENYPHQGGSSEPVKASGILIREFPNELLEGKVRILSMAALMSTERVKLENKGVGSSHCGGVEGFERLPLIFEVMEATIKKGLAKSPEDFIYKYLIVGYIDSVEGTTFQENMPIEPHSQNLCIVLNNDLTPRGYAYRDHGGIWVDLATRGLQGKDMSPFHREKGDGNIIFKSKGAISRNYIGSFSWFYRYQVFIKTMNLLTRLSDEMEENMPVPPGAPSQIGCNTELTERNLQKYVFKKLEGDASCRIALKKLKTLSLTFEQYLRSLQLLDHYYYQTMNRYFDMEKVNIESVDGTFPAAEGGAPDEKRMFRHRGFLGKYRFNQISSSDMRVKIKMLPQEILDKILTNSITSFGNQTAQMLNVKEVMLLSEGVALFDDKSEIIGFTPYSTSGEKEWIKREISRMITDRSTAKESAKQKT